ncbi:MAG: hypothetical protein DPW16_12990 [Chloroflexi bacterium]|nr:hypothetical protein [Chloroflexota bacterium]
MSNKTPLVYDYRLNIQVTHAMHERLAQLATIRGVSKAELTREALRVFMDQQEDLVGSRKFFAKSFQRRLDHVDWQFSVLFRLVSNLMAVVLKAQTGKKPAEEDIMGYMLTYAMADDWQSALHEANLKRQKHEPPVE